MLMVFGECDSGIDSGLGRISRAEKQVDVLNDGFVHEKSRASFFRLLGQCRGQEATGGDRPRPSELSVLAMSHSKLNHPDQARAALARLRELIQDPKYKDDDEAHGFLREAEELIGGTRSEE